MIDLILLERVDGLGTMGQTVKVRPGYARNYLLPQKKALRATKANAEFFDKQRAELEARNAAERAKAEKLATTIEGLTFIVIRQASEMGQLFGSVNARDVVEAAQTAGHVFSRPQVQIDSPIKTLGLFSIRLKLHPEVSSTVTINVARSPEEATVQAQKHKTESKPTEEKSDFDSAFFGESSEPVDLLNAEEEAKPAKKGKKAAATEEADESAPKPKKPRAKKAAAE